MGKAKAQKILGRGLDFSFATDRFRPDVSAAKGDTVHQSHRR